MILRSFTRANMLTMRHETSLCEDWQPSVPPPRHSRERHYVRLKATIMYETSPDPDQESDSLLVSLPRFLSDSQATITRLFSQIHVQLTPRYIAYIAREAHSLCRGALAVDRYRRVLPIQVNVTGTVSVRSLLDSTSPLPPGAELREAVATAAEGKAQCSICFEALGQWIVPMPCSHAYHKLCIARWFNKSRTCPLCRYRMPTRRYASSFPSGRLRRLD